MSKDIIIGIDAGTSVIKSVAFDLSGRQIDTAAIPNQYDTAAGGAATQPMARTWDDCAATLRLLADKVPDLATRTAAVAVTGQGDGTWLIDQHGAPVTDGWLWLDARAGQIAEDLRQQDGDPARYEITGTGLAACQQGVQLAHMRRHSPEVLDQADLAFHCKDWLYLQLTGERVTDPSEGLFTFGDFRTRTYSDEVVDFLGLSAHRHLIAPMCDGVDVTHPLSAEAARQTGLLQGTPISLGYVDVVCTTLGAGGYLPGQDTGCTIVGTTGVHIRCKPAAQVQLNEADRTGYVMVLPVPGQVTHLQTNMAGTLNIDWVLGLAADVCKSVGVSADHARLLGMVENWISQTEPGRLIYHPYISEAGERGPFIDHTARTSIIGLSTAHGFGDLVRGAVEGLAMASRDCYSAMGAVPCEVTLTGGAARSDALRGILSATLGASVRQSTRAEAGAAGAAMMSAVAIGAYSDMSACIQDWVMPLLGPQEAPDPDLSDLYDTLYPDYVAARRALRPLWPAISQRRSAGT